MKYKVTITSTDLTGHEDEKEVHENLTEDGLLMTIGVNKGKSILIKPMPEKQKVTVWFYVIENINGFFYSLSSPRKETIITQRDFEIKKGRKVSDIKSMEVEI
jgi:hypothetical protein